MTRIRHVIGVSLLLAMWASATAADFTGVVTHVTDGDTLWVRPASGGAPTPGALRASMHRRSARLSEPTRVMRFLRACCTGR